MNKVLGNPVALSELDVKEDSLYRVVVSFGKGNPWFPAYLLVGFITNNGKAGNYSKLTGTDINETDITEFKDIRVAEVEYLYTESGDVVTPASFL